MFGIIILTQISKIIDNNIQMKEVRLNDKFWFGKHQNKRIFEIIKGDPAYIHKLINDGKIKLDKKASELFNERNGSTPFEIRRSISRPQLFEEHGNSPRQILNEHQPVLNDGDGNDRIGVADDVSPGDGRVTIAVNLIIPLVGIISGNSIDLIVFEMVGRLSRDFSIYLDPSKINHIINFFKTRVTCNMTRREMLDDNVLLILAMKASNTTIEALDGNLNLRIYRGDDMIENIIYHS